MHIKDNFLVATAYLLGIPALYIALTDYRKKDYVGFHGSQALVLWCWFFVILFGIRFLVDIIWSFTYFPMLIWLENLAIVGMAGYALFCAYRSFTGLPAGRHGQIFKIPH